MKPLMLLSVLVAASACSRPDTSPVADGAASAAQAPATGDARADASSVDAPPPDAGGARGIAVGEPHPSGSVAVDAGPARADGYGDLRLGMTADEARKAWKGELKGDDVKADNCAYLSPAGTAAGPYLMFEQGRFVRYDVHGANTVAPGGGHVGLSADDIRRLYAGRVEERPHQYVEGGKYLRVVDAASKSRAMVFEIDEHGRVTTWRVGRAPQVDYVEGCS
ncbi:hypothetical protein GCM10008101_26060 [Lysobacter xinjiangensis]|uniref:Lectin n=1 Tax=Cognatilysobacter xinjiangensis TaxID=546892 RepID=A0ABQ3CA58_9GAMM|nr:lectin [Lysobacter xinjiangensis]GGZ70545.1 hypothetical protein GCM10008101_26060 [Lysobacter xinjiangensis]